MTSALWVELSHHCVRLWSPTSRSARTEELMWGPGGIAPSVVSGCYFAVITYGPFSEMVFFEDPKLQPFHMTQLYNITAPPQLFAAPLTATMKCVPPSALHPAPIPVQSSATAHAQRDAFATQDTFTAQGSVSNERPVAASTMGSTTR